MTCLYPKHQEGRCFVCYCTRMSTSADIPKFRRLWSVLSLAGSPVPLHTQNHATYQRLLPTPARVCHAACPRQEGFLPKIVCATTPMIASRSATARYVQVTCTTAGLRGALQPCLYRMSARPLRARVPTPTPMPWEGVFQPVARAADRTHAHLPISLAVGADHAPTAAACSPAASYLTASTHAPPAKCSRHGSLGVLVAHGVPG
jgi:hypothetical protein